MFRITFFRFFRYLTWRTLKKTVASTIESRLLGLASEIAFNAILSLFPAILAILTAIGLFEESLQETFRQLAMQLSTVAPKEALVLMQDFAKEITQSKNSSLFSLSFFVAIWTASGAVSTVMTALDQIQKVPPNKIRPFWKAKLISLGLTIASILLLLLACFLLFISDWLLLFIVRRTYAPFILVSIWQWLRLPLTLSMVAGVFAFIYRTGPSMRYPNTPILPGAILAAGFWATLSLLFRSYVENFGNYNKAYGAVGTVIVLMLWLQLSATVLLIGDQLNVTVGEAWRSSSRSQK